MKKLSKKSAIVVVVTVCAVLSVVAVFHGNTNQTQTVTMSAKPFATQEIYGINSAAMSAKQVTTQGIYEIKHFLTNDTKVSSNEKAWRLLSYLRTPSYSCSINVRLGDDDDGGWHVCLDPPFQLTQPCLVYSFGINNDWTFDDHISTSLGCVTHCFDPSINKDSYQRSKLITFHHLGLLGKPNPKWAMATFQDIRNKLGHADRTIDVVKMDIEASELEALENMAETGQLADIKQLSVEVHENVLQVEGTHRVLLLLENHGFRKYLYNSNRYCAKLKCRYTNFKRTLCHEIHYINTKFLK